MNAKTAAVATGILALALALAGCGHLTWNNSPNGSQPTQPAQTLNWHCTVDSGQDTAGWTMTFTNPSGTDITVEDYTVVFFSASGGETGSLDAQVDQPIIVAANNSVSDVEHHDFDGDPDPAGSASCRLATWQGGSQ